MESAFDGRIEGEQRLEFIRILEMAQVKRIMKHTMAMNTAKRWKRCAKLSLRDGSRVNGTI